MKITKGKLMKELSRKFPGMWIKDGVEFCSNYSNSIWTGEGSMIDNIPVFDQYGYEPMYVLGVHKELVEFLDQYDLYTEAYDGGTYFIFLN